MAAWWWLWTVFLSIGARRALADSLEVERLFNVTPESTALFLSAASVSSSRPDGRLSGRRSTPPSSVLAGLHDDGRLRWGGGRLADSS